MNSEVVEEPKSEGVRETQERAPKGMAWLADNPNPNTGMAWLADNS
jgi:hypothetical protein